jgi:hypothetical protein
MTNTNKPQMERGHSVKNWLAELRILTDLPNSNQKAQKCVLTESFKNIEKLYKTHYPNLK